jgi:hypothetical protein
MEVHLLADGQSTLLLKINTPTAWKHFWADLSPWAGKTVAFEVMMHQGMNDLLSNAEIDSVSIGSWSIPVIDSVTPDHGLYPQTQLTIKGQDFVPQSFVKLDDQVLFPIQFIDETTLVATIPMGIIPGSHTLWVNNPNAMQNAYQESIVTGNFVKLPFVVK